MAEVDPAALRDLALELAVVADGIAISHFGGPVPAVAKPDGSPVTAADREIERALREELARARPDHLVLGEEEGGRVDPDVPTWVIDPIDGTKGFLRGLPVFATLIGVLLRGEVIAAVASAPALAERWDAYLGGGARRNGAPVGVSAIATLAESHVLHGGLDWWRGVQGGWDALGRLSDASWRTRGFGDFWMHLLVAGGTAEVAVERDLKLWDVAAIVGILREAGGRATAWDGGDPLTSDSLLSTNGLVHHEVLAYLPG